MALIKCVDCGKDFSDAAAACPNCGRPNKPAAAAAELPKKQDSFARGCATILGVASVVICLWLIFNFAGDASTDGQISVRSTGRPETPTVSRWNGLWEGEWSEFDVNLGGYTGYRMRIRIDGQAFQLWRLPNPQAPDGWGDPYIVGKLRDTAGRYSDTGEPYEAKTLVADRRPWNMSDLVLDRGLLRFYPYDQWPRRAFATLSRK